VVQAFPVGAFLARVCLTAAVSTEPTASVRDLDVPSARAPAPLELATPLSPADQATRASLRLESGAVELGVEVGGQDAAHARVELAVSTRVAAFSVRF
jgi:hypothetical protein